MLLRPIGAAGFANVSSAVRLPDGRIAVGDQGDLQVILFDSLGIETSRFGRRGTGPGEWQEIGGIEAIGNQIGVVGGARLVQVFDSSGKYLRSLRFQSPPQHTVMSHPLALWRGDMLVLGTRAHRSGKATIDSVMVFGYAARDSTWRVLGRFPDAATFQGPTDP